jgi:hypothetical protein
MKFIHDFSLSVSVTSSKEDFDDVEPELVLLALKRRVREMEDNKKNWRDCADHFATNEEIK